MNFTKTESDFVTGLIIICAISFVIKYVSLIAFNLTLSDKDSKTLELFKNDKIKAEDIQISTHTTVLTLLNQISHFSFFLNSAILGSVFIKEYL